MSAGRLADPTVSLGTDPRVDPRIPAALAPFGLDGLAPPSPVAADSPRADQLAFIAAAEAGFETIFGALTTGLPAIEGVTRETVMVARARRPRDSGLCPSSGGRRRAAPDRRAHPRRRDDAADRRGHGLRPRARRAGGERPDRARRRVPQRGRQARQPPVPRPASTTAPRVRWALAERTRLGGSGVVVSGELGGGNLTLAVSHRARREGWLGEIAGFYAQCPFIHGGWANPPTTRRRCVRTTTTSSAARCSACWRRSTTPTARTRGHPECWPLQATAAELAEMPPHVISVNELDPLRDEGLAYYRALTHAGVSVHGRLVAGTCHGGDILFPSAIPEVHAASIRDSSAASPTRSRPDPRPGFT